MSPVSPLADPRWDAKLASFPGASFFHGAHWARALHATYGYRPCYFVEERAGRLRGVLAMMEVDSWLTGRRGVGLPFTDECPLLAEDAGVAARLMAAANEFAAQRQWRYWEVRGTAHLDAPPAIAFHGHTLALQPEAGRLLVRCDKATRTAVRKAEHSALTITLSQGMDAMCAFHVLLCKTRRRHGLPPQPLALFQNIQRHVLAAQRGCIVLARSGGRAVAGAVFFHCGRSALFKFGASDMLFQDLRPNNLVMWRAIEWHARAGFETLDFGRTSLGNEGLRRFKLGWGTAERRLAYVRFDCRARAFVTTPDRSSGWHSQVFKLVPQPLARLIGAATYKHVA